MRWIPFSVASRFFPERTMQPRFNNTSIIAARVAGVPRPVSFIASESSLIQALARRLHRCQECALGESFRRPGLLLLGFNINDVLEPPLGERYGKDLLWSFLPTTAFRISSPFCSNIEDLPTHLLHKGSRGSIPV